MGNTRLYLATSLLIAPLTFSHSSLKETLPSLPLLAPAEGTCSLVPLNTTLTSLDHKPLGDLAAQVSTLSETTNTHIEALSSVLRDLRRPPTTASEGAQAHPSLRPTLDHASTAVFHIPETKKFLPPKGVKAPQTPPSPIAPNPSALLNRRTHAFTQAATAQEKPRPVGSPTSPALRERLKSPHHLFIPLGAERASPEVQLTLAMLYYQGALGEVDLPQYLKYLQLSAKGGNAQAQVKLAQIYMGGRDQEEKNLQTASKWAKLAHKQGDHEGQNLLGLIYEEQENFKLALHYFKKSAAQKNPAGLYNLGRYHYFGKTIPKNILLAEKNFSLSCERDYAFSCMTLGIIHLHGEHPLSTLKKALTYLKLAVALGSQEAGTLLEQIEQGAF